MSKYISNALNLLFLFSVSMIFAQNPNDSVKVAGAMKNVMQKGQLFGTIALDTITNKQHLYGLGPLEYLTGELLIIDGKAYQSTVVSNSKMKVEEKFEVKAPFFVFANIEQWKEHKLPKSVKTLSNLEKYLDKVSIKKNEPFAFKMVGIVKSANIHLVNLPAGTIVKSPADAHKGQINYQLENKEVEIIGFFSRKHQAIFTHHDSYIHTHLITKDRLMMGHLEGVNFDAKNMKIYLPLF
jgi:acetolactate decarboxylase